MTVTLQIPKNTSTAAPGATLFPYAFKIVQAADLLVTVDGVAKTLGVHYTVSGVGTDGGDVTFVAPMVGGETVTRKRNMQYSRSTDYQNLGDLHSSVLNNDQDGPVLMIQQLAAAIANALRLSDGDAVGVNLTLPKPGSLSPLVWNALGTALENGSTALTGDMLLRPNLAGNGAGQGSDLVAVRDTLAPAFLKTTSDILNGEAVSLIRNIAPAKHASLRAGTLTDNLQPAAAELIAAMGTQGYGKLLFGIGEHRFTAPLVLPPGIMLEGQGCVPYTGPNAAATPRGKGSWLHFDHAGIGINVVGGTAASASCTIARLGTRRTHATPGAGWVPTVYDYDFAVEGVETFLDDVLLLNAYKGAVIRSSGYGRLWTHRLRGQVFSEGLNLQQSFDTCRIRDSHFWPYWSQQADVTAWQRANTKVVRIARADNSLISGLFSIYSLVGIEVYGTGDGTAYKLRISDVDVDSVSKGLSVAATSDSTTIWMTNFTSLGHTGDVNSRGIEMLGNNGTLNGLNVDLALCGKEGLRVDGTGNTVYLTGAKARVYNQSAIGSSAYEVAAGNRVEFADRPVFSGGGAGPLFGAVANVYKAPLGSGLGSGTTNGSGDLVITHGLGTTPQVVISGVGNGNNRVELQGATATTFTVRLLTVAGAAAPTTACNFWWSAVKA